jgi:hypothetical protein
MRGARAAAAGWAFAMAAGVGGGAGAQEPAPSREEFEAVRKRLEALESKEQQRSETEREHRLPHLHGYGDIHFNRPRLNTLDADEPARVDFHRIVLGLDQDLSDSIYFSMELDFEHALKAADLELEFAYLGFKLAPGLEVRAGALLMPVGPLNEFHEPTLYYSVERPYTQRSLIPTTWQEVGAGVVGTAFDGGLSYRAYVVNGLDASKFNALDGLRGGRGKGGQEAPAEDLAGVLRLESPVLTGLVLGGSLYAGGADHDIAGLNDPFVTLSEVDALVTVGDLEFRGVFVHTRVSQADDVNAKVAAANRPVGEVMQGGYLEAAHHVLRALDPDSGHDLVAFVRWEDIDTNKEMPSGVQKSGAAERAVGSVGVAYYPIPAVAIKADYERWRDGTHDRVSRWNLGLGFVY